jgi:uncharacterized protein (AIM24 family)
VTLAPPQQLHSAGPSHFLYCSDGCTLEQRPRLGSGGWFSRLFSGQAPDDFFVNLTPQIQYVGLSIPHAGKIVPVEVRPGAPALLVQNECYLGSLGPASHQRIVIQAALHTEQLPMQKITCLPTNVPRPFLPAPTATVFLHAGGTVVEKKLQDGESMYVQAASIAAMTEGVSVHPSDRGVPVAVPAGGGMVNYGPAPRMPGWGTMAKSYHTCIVRGPGTVWVSNLPGPRVARHVLNARGGALEAALATRLVKFFVLLFFACGIIGAVLQSLSIDFHHEL